VSGRRAVLGSGLRIRHSGRAWARGVAAVRRAAAAETAEQAKKATEHNYLRWNYYRHLSRGYDPSQLQKVYLVMLHEEKS
jgi:hypothetical protein